MNSEKIGFFKRVYLAMTDFRTYPYILKESTGKAIWYFIKLILVISMIMGIFFTSNFFDASENALKIFDEVMPEFSIVNGELKIDEKFENEINENVYLMVDSEYKYSDISNITIEEENAHDYYILVLQDATSIVLRDSSETIELAKVPYENITTTKTGLMAEWGIFNTEIVGKVLVWVCLSFAVFIILLIAKIWTLLMYIISALIINFAFGLKLRMADYLKVVIYASTLPSILEIIAIIAVGGISQTINFISMLVSLVYIFYALRAIKIDSLFGTFGKAAEENMKSALLRAKEELNKQLQELEKKEQETTGKEQEEIKELENINKELLEKEENLFKAQKEYEETVKKVMELGEKSKSNLTNNEENSTENTNNTVKNNNEKQNLKETDDQNKAEKGKQDGSESNEQDNSKNKEQDEKVSEEQDSEEGKK